MRAPRATARSQFSSSSADAPSPITNPSRSASNGREACSGSSLRPLRAVMRANAEIATGVIHDSLPPVITTSDVSSRMRRAASPIACALAAHAVEMQRFGPVHPSCMATVPAVALVIIIGTRKGLTRAGPFSTYTCSCSSSVMSPPMPVPRITAQRAGSALGSPASASASTAAANPSCVTRSRRRASFGPRYAVGSKSGTSPPMRTASGDGAYRLIVPAVERPLSNRDQYASTVVPAGVLTPRPVTATRGRPRVSVPPPGATRLGPDFGEHEVDCVTHRCHALEVVLGNFDVEALLESHHELDEVEAVGVEVFFEACTFGDARRLDAQHFRGNILDRCQCVGAFHAGFLSGFE